MEKIQVGELILFKQSFLGGLEDHEIYGVSNESGNWVSLNDLAYLLGFSYAKKKRFRQHINEEDKCMFRVERFNGCDADKNNDEYFIRDTAVYGLLMKDREERKNTEQFIFDVLGQLNNGQIQCYVDAKYAKEIKAYREWLESDNELFVAHKKDNKIDIWEGPSIDEALDILYNAGLEK